MDFKGLSQSQVEENRKKFGSNALTQLPLESLLKKIIKGLADPMIMILLAALLIQLVMFFTGSTEWYEIVGVLLAVLIADGVSAVSEKKQESKASDLKEEQLSKEITKVVRDSVFCEISVSDVVVDDIVFLQSGDRIPADGQIVSGEIKVDQSTLNGESEEANKRPLGRGEEFNEKDLLNCCYVYRGTVVCSGEAYMRVGKVGDETLFGSLALEVQEAKRKTPLQVKLSHLARQISVFGYIGALCIIVAIMVKAALSGEVGTGFSDWLQVFLNALTIAVSIIVCAVPEGLPMLTSVLLSFQSMRMIKDNVLVRKLNGLETAGSLSLLFTDKTGTITEGRLSVSGILTGSGKKFSSLSAMPQSLKKNIISAIGINNSAVSSGGKVLGGNSTDRALMAFLLSEQVADTLRKEDVRKFNAFDSAKKFSSVTITRDGKSETYIKGAPEKIIDRCTRYVDETGELRTFANADAIKKYMDEQSSKSMRLLAAARADGEDAEGELTLICLLSIRDNVRKEAAQAIKDVQRAGVQVVMVTGDRKETALAIAKESGLLTSDDEVVLTSAEMALKTDDELKRVMPHLRVVARALPSDKSRLVRIAQEMNYVTGMTGDGVNDSPALRKADVGFAMGSGTEVAKEAGDITILDDNFLSIKKAILYGRTMFRSIRKFLVFQLTVNVAAVLISFIAPLLGAAKVLTVIQLLFINLVMDTLAAVAFAGEPPLEEYMHFPPVPRSEHIVSRQMFCEIVTASLYILLVCLAMLFIPAFGRLFDTQGETGLKSALFAVFMMSIAFNGFNARTEHFNLLKGIGENRGFVLIMASVLVLQFIFVTFGGSFLSVQPLSPRCWLACCVAAAVVFPVDLLRKFLNMRFGAGGCEAHLNW